VHRLRGDCLDGGKHVLYAMVELGDQPALLVLCPFSLRDINVDADQARWMPIAVVGNEATRFDPPRVAISADKAILNV
jgi:hypothetical protein